MMSYLTYVSYETLVALQPYVPKKVIPQSWELRKYVPVRDERSIEERMLNPKGE